jgi:hypothetical protein
MKNTRFSLLIRIGFSIEIIIWVVIGGGIKYYSMSDSTHFSEAYPLVVGSALLLLLPKLIIGGLITDSAIKKQTPSIGLTIYSIITIFPYLNIVSGFFYFASINQFKITSHEDNKRN